VPYRERLQDTRDSVTHKFSVAGDEGYITVGLYPDGRPAEEFIKMAKEDSTVGGLMDAISILTSLALQYGKPVENMTRKFQHTRFAPSGHTTNPELREVTSHVDYIFTWLALSEECRTEAASNTPHTEGPLQ
jgi:ribonucleoside-diphosphate reductase alpha chain